MSFDLANVAIQANPYPAYARLRDAAPLEPVAGLPMWVVSRHEDIEMILRDHATFSSDLGMNVPLMSMVMKDAPDHTRLRQTVNRAFTPRNVQHLAPRIAEIAHSLLDAAATAVDFVQAYANPLSVTVICEMLGVSLARRDGMNRYARDALLASFAATGQGSPELLAEARSGLDCLMAILNEAIEQHLISPADNIISALVAEEAKGVLSRDELRNLCALLLIGGHETTANLIASGGHVLAVDPALLATLRGAPEMIPKFVEELARMRSPLQRIARRTTRSARVAGQDLPANTLLMLFPGSANRDARRWADPDRLDLARDGRGHLGFGTGVHVCPGAPLARLEARIAFEVLLQRVQDLRPDPASRAIPIAGYAAGNLGWNVLPLLLTRATTGAATGATTGTASAPALREAAFRPLDAAVLNDPYPVYARLRQTQPVAWSTTEVAGYTGFWFVSGFADVAAGLKDNRFGHDGQRVMPGGSIPPSPAHAPLRAMLTDWMLFKDPPEHGRLRRIATPVFSLRAVLAMRPRIAVVVEAALDRIPADGAFDMVSAFASPLSIDVVADLLGVPAADLPLVRDWVREITLALDLARTPDRMTAGAHRAGELVAYFDALVTEHRRRPRDDLLSILVATHDAGGFLSARELLAACALFLMAGHEASFLLICNGLRALARHPDQWQALRGGRVSLKSAIAELQRYDSPRQISFRHALEDIDFAGVPIRRGELVGFGLGAANRDPRAFENPDTLDLARDENRHLAFGAGIHSCPGAGLAQLEAELVFAGLSRLFPVLRIVEAEQQQSIMVRGLTRLMLDCSVSRAIASGRCQPDSAAR